MQKFFEITHSTQQGIYSNERVCETPEIKALLEDGWKIINIHCISAGAGAGSSDFSETDIVIKAFLVLEK